MVRGRQEGMMNRRRKERRRKSEKRKMEKKMEGQRLEERVKKIGRENYRKIERSQPDRPTDSQTYRQTDTDRQSDDFVIQSTV